MKTKKVILQSVTVFGMTALLLTPLLARNVEAQVVRSFTIVPPTVAQTIDPGASGQGSMKVINDSDTPLTFTTTIEDFVVNDTKGTPQFITDTSTPDKYSAASWLGVSPTTFTVPPHEKQDLQYFYKVPSDARPGGHYAGIIYQPSNGTTVNGVGTAVNTVVGSLFYFTVNGTITENARVAAFLLKQQGVIEQGPVTIESLIQNQGDLHIRPSGSITVTDMFGRQIETQSLQSVNIFPGASRSYENIVARNTFFGKYTATLKATYGKSNNLPLSASISFWIIPWKLLTVAALGIVALVLALLLILRRKKVQPVKTTESEEGTIEEHTQETKTS